jgi:hypothetical protein
MWMGAPIEPALDPWLQAAATNRVKGKGGKAGIPRLPLDEASFDDHFAGSRDIMAL